MARLPRFDVPGYTQHVIQRGNNRSIIFAGEEDYAFYLKKLGDACKKQRINGVRLDSYRNLSYTAFRSRNK